MLSEEFKSWYENEAPNELDVLPVDMASEAWQAALRAQADAQPVGYAVAMPGAGGFTTACFDADTVPVDSPLFLHPAPEAAQALSDWDRISRAAQSASYQYGQWMPERWLQLFVNAYNGGEQ